MRRGSWTFGLAIVLAVVAIGYMVWRGQFYPDARRCEYSGGDAERSIIQCNSGRKSPTTETHRKLTGLGAGQHLNGRFAIAFARGGEATFEGQLSTNAAGDAVVWVFADRDWGDLTKLEFAPR